MTTKYEMNKESAISSAFMAYLSRTGNFGAFQEKQEDWI
jgi:hypothetical protein